MRVPPWRGVSPLAGILAFALVAAPGERARAQARRPAPTAVT